MKSQIMKDLENAKRAQPQPISPPQPPKDSPFDRLLRKQTDEANKERARHLAGMKRGVRK